VLKWVPETKGKTLEELETVFIDKETKLRSLKNELRWSEVYCHLNKK